MKLHLPLNLYRALLLALFAAPALIHADNEENTENSPSVGYTNINGDIQYTDSFIRENVRYIGLNINTLIFEELIDVLFYNNIANYEGGAFICDNGNASFVRNGNIAFQKNVAPSSGGAIANEDDSTITLSGNVNIAFEENRVTRMGGGAIINERNSSITLSSNINISFIRNSGTSNGGAIYNYYNSSITFNNNENITFEGNNTTGDSFPRGGAIYNGSNSSITFNNNENITFEGNHTTGDSSTGGGAIYNYSESSIEFNNNANITFGANKATTTGVEISGAYGGAIYNYDNGSISFSCNENICFVGNSVKEGSLADYDFDENTSYGRGSGAEGGAIYNDRSSTITFSSNKIISFEGNSSTGFHANSGAIYNYNESSIEFNNNGNISFVKNSATDFGTTYPLSDDARTEGGAIYNYSESSIEFNNNTNISFEENSATSISDADARAYGGAIYNFSKSTIAFNNSTNISFEENRVTGTGDADARAYGGAIYNYSESSIEFNNNTNISFEENSATSISDADARAYGGAIYNDRSSTITFNNNANISFVENSAAGNSTVSGGAIYNSGDSLSFIGNKDITFQGNSVTGTGEGSAQGGAIYNYLGDFILSNNGNVLFEKNIEISDDTYRLRSIYSEGNLILGAADNKKIEFRDSIFSNRTTSFNADYVDESGNTIKQTGDIIFTGAYTEAHLKEAKGGINGTADELLASRTNEIQAITTLYGGRLRIEDGAIFKGRTFNVAENANATVLLRQGTLDLGKNYDLTISANSTLSVLGENTINASNVIIKEGGTLQMALDMTQMDSAAVLTTTGNLSMSNISFDLTGTEYLVTGDYKLLTRTEGVNYDISGWTLNGVTADKLRWENGTLYYTGGHDWNHGVSDDDDINDLEEILGNLIINGGDITLDDVVGAIQDAVDDGFGHGQGHIVINRGGIHITGAGDLDGHIIFNGDLKDIRKLFIEKNITNIKIELGGSSAAQNIVDVGGEYTVEIDELSGDGSMNKTGEGEMVIHGNGHKVGGTLNVQEGSLTFSVGSGATGNEAETEINELVVGNKEDKKAKVKVDKDNKIKGNKLHVNGKNAVVTNEGTMEFTGEVKVEAGHLDNQGSISKVTLEGGSVSGSGSFDGLEMNGGELIVGNSPGLQTFTNGVELNEGMVIFSLSDAGIAATEETHGWDSAAYSTMDMGGNALTLSENVNFVLEIGGRALENLLAADGAALTFSLNLIQNIAPESLTLNEEALAALLDNTKIIITKDDDGLSEGILQLAGIDITSMLSDAQYTYEGNTLVFSGTVTHDGSLTIPEPTTTTLSLLVLASMAARRRRK